MEIPIQSQVSPLQRAWCNGSARHAIKPSDPREHPCAALRKGFTGCTRAPIGW
jgi:hypothetical protein